MDKKMEGWLDAKAVLRNAIGKAVTQFLSKFYSFERKAQNRKSCYEENSNLYETNWDQFQDIVGKSVFKPRKVQSA